MEKLDDIKQNLKKLFDGDSKIKWIVLIGFIGMILILISCLWPQEKKDNKTSSTEVISTQEYVEQLEKKVTSMVSEIEGVGQVKVMITLENGVENVYANSEKKVTDYTSGLSSNQSTQRKDSEQEVVIVDGGNGKKALVVTQKEPTVKGVVVVCEGADRTEVITRVTSAVTTCLNIKSNRVSVVKSSVQKQN